MKSSGYHGEGQSFVPKAQRGLQRILEQHADVVIGSSVLDAAITAAIGQQLSQRELLNLVFDVERGLAI